VPILVGDVVHTDFNFNNIPSDTLAIHCEWFQAPYRLCNNVFASVYEIFFHAYP